MYTDMEEWAEIRLRVLNGKATKREILREKGMHGKMLEKILSYSEPPGYRMGTERPRPKIGPFLERISEILEGDKEVPKKQRHTAKRMYERIQEEGYQGKYTQVKEAVTKGLQVRAHTRDAVAQFLIPQPPWKPSTFRLDGREHLQLVRVAGPDISAYGDLLTRGGIP